MEKTSNDHWLYLYVAAIFIAMNLFLKPYL